NSAARYGRLHHTWQHSVHVRTHRAAGGPLRSRDAILRSFHWLFSAPSIADRLFGTFSDKHCSSEAFPRSAITAKYGCTPGAAAPDRGAGRQEWHFGEVCTTRTDVRAAAQRAG